MPIYEYKCGKCETIVEKIHGMNEKPVVKCPSCGERARRQMSRGSFILKGTGWYATDYGKKSKMPEPPCPGGKNKEGSTACAACPAKTMPKLNSDPS